MKRPNILNKQDPPRKNSYKDNITNKNSYYNNTNRQQQKSSFNYIQQTKLRIVQQNLVTVTGLSTDFDNPDLLCDNQHFGKYGTVNKLIISTQGKHKAAFIQVYITFQNPAEAAFTIKAMDGIKITGKEISATFGTTKYCTYFLKQNQCRNQKCFYLHQFDTKNQLSDGVKNNLDFLDQKAQKIINKNLKTYIEKEYKQKTEKEQSEFPSYTETIQYLIDEEILKKQIVDKLRIEVQNEKKMNKKEQKQQSKLQVKNQSNLKYTIKQTQKNKNIPKNKYQQIISNSNDSQSNKTNIATQSKVYQDSLIQEQQKIQQQQSFIQVESKNKKCNSLSTAPSPTKYQKLTQIQEQSIDKTIEKRIINQIMKNKLIYKSKMDFVTHIPHYAKQQNNKIINYVRKHLLNEI